MLVSDAQQLTRRRADSQVQPGLAVDSWLYGAVWRRRPKSTSLQQSVLAQVSSVIAPTLPDWPESVHVTGYWAMDVKDQVAKFQPSAELRAFLEAGLLTGMAGPSRRRLSIRRRWR